MGKKLSIFGGNSNIELLDEICKLVKIKQGDMYAKITGEFDTILLNPPQHAGKDVCMKMIENAIKYLKNGGLLQLVARHNKGGKSFEKKMKEVFGNVKDIAKKGGFRVYVAKAVNSRND